MSHSFEVRPRTRREFLINRLIRIYPTYFIALTLSFLLLWHQDYSLHVLLNYLMVGSLGHDLVRLPVNNLALWSITYEMIFYYLFSLCIVQDQISSRRIWVWTFCALAMFFMVGDVKFDSGPMQLLAKAFAFSLSWLIGFQAHQNQNVLGGIPFSVRMGGFLSLLAVS